MANINPTATVLCIRSDTFGIVRDSARDLPDSVELLIAERFRQGHTGETMAQVYALAYEAVMAAGVLDPTDGRGSPHWYETQAEALEEAHLWTQAAHAWRSAAGCSLGHGRSARYHEAERRCLSNAYPDNCNARITYLDGGVPHLQVTVRGVELEPVRLNKRQALAYHNAGLPESIRIGGKRS